MNKRAGNFAQRGGNKMCHQIECGCGHHTHIPAAGWHHRSLCCDTGYISRRFPTGEERIEELEHYLKQLKAEARGVGERLARLRKESQA